MRHAFDGIAHAWRTQRNLRIQVALGAIAAIVFVALRIAALGFAILALSIALVLAMEILNTSIEALVDLVSPERHPLAKAAKDAAAGAVLVAAGGAAVVGAFLLWAALQAR